MLNALRRKYKTLNTVRINAEALKNNLKLYQRLLPNQAICPVIKSNAYGHGLTTVAKILDSQNLEFLVVDSLYEAYELKKVRIKTPILILGYTFPENLKKGLPFHFAASDLETAKHLAKLGLKTHLEVDTGMARTGFPLENLRETLNQLKDLNLVGLFSHFADADNPADPSYTNEQSKRFRKAIKLTHEAGFSPKYIHLSNSAGALKAEVPGLNMARIGISLYGASPLEEEPQLKGLKPVMEVVSTITATRELKAGQSVSYNCTFTAKKDMRIGVIPFGYYEGIPRSLSNVPPFLGRICMNHTIIDLTDSDLQIGDEFTVYSANPNKENSFRNLAQKAQTIPYELMTGIAESIRRTVT
jgi:alanine racemase